MVPRRIGLVLSVVLTLFVFLAPSAQAVAPSAVTNLKNYPNNPSINSITLTWAHRLLE